MGLVPKTGASWSVLAPFWHPYLRDVNHFLVPLPASLSAIDPSLCYCHHQTQLHPTWRLFHPGGQQQTHALMKKSAELREVCLGPKRFLRHSQCDPKWLHHHPLWVQQMHGLLPPLPALFWDDPGPWKSMELCRNVPTICIYMYTIVYYTILIYTLTSKEASRNTCSNESKKCILWKSTAFLPENVPLMKESVAISYKCSAYFVKYFLRKYCVRVSKRIIVQNVQLHW